ncbi:MAG: pseudouridylate synthase [Prevotellaceae bacterium]|jgi:predicted hotdog family 3-hydroxylacyl-ACP dehydratase|nr:pseudouridylate synthase [Prevotellaceae bacterium]
MEQIQHINVRELLPQQGTFVMIDKLEHLDEKTVISCTTVKSDNIFVSGKIFSESGIIENIAQTAAARIGYVCRYILKDSIKLGFIGEIKNFVLNRCPQVGEKIITSIEIVNEIYSTLLLRAEVKTSEELLASCNMKVFITDVNS